MAYQLKNGRWRAVKMIAGQRKTKICHTKAEARKWEAEQDAALWQAQTNTICLLDALTGYLDYSQARHHEKTFIAKKYAARRLLSYLRKNALPEDVTPRLALIYVMDRARDGGNAAANKDRKHMAAFWEYGIKFYGFPPNPFRQVEKLPENSEPHYVPPVEDFWKVYAVADDLDRAMLLGLLYTAGRRSEPLRWTWEDDIDLQGRRIRLSTCKTADGSRKYEWLTMPATLHDALIGLKLATGGHGHVFTSKKTGEPYKERKHFIERLCRKANVRGFNFHGIRGLTASLLAQGGVPMKEIQHILLHSRMTTTDRYIRRIGGTSDVLAAAFDRFDATRKARRVIPFPAGNKKAI